MVHNGSVGIPNIIFVSTSDATDARVLNNGKSTKQNKYCRNTLKKPVKR